MLSGRCALPLRWEYFLAWSFSVTVAAGHASTGHVTERSSALAIPQWKLDQVLGNTESASIPGPASQELSGSVAASEQPVVESSAGQDSGRCPVVKLPSKLGMTAQESSWVSQGGVWQSTSDVVHSSFRQWFLSLSWDTAYIRNLDELSAVQADVTGDNELEYLYGWRRVQSPMDFPAIAKLEDDWWKAIYNGAYTPSKSPQQKYGQSSDALWHTVALLDCDGRLLFVVKLLQQDVETVPGGIDIYDRLGQLVAHAMTDTKIAKFQFVDTSGNLLATAEAPGIDLAVSMEALRTDPSKGNILPYEIKFEQGGYTNSSRLLDPEYRWVLAAAVQARALNDGHRGWAPWAPKLLVTLYCVFGVIIVLLMCCACGAIYRLVYPRGDVDGLPPLWDKKGQRHFYSYPDPSSKTV